MKTSYIKIFIFTIFLGFLAGLCFLYKDTLYKFIYNLPCQEPITYSINSFDGRFEISKEDFLKDIKQAEKIWEDAINKDLFAYSKNEDLKINLIYDYRQAATKRLQKLGLVIEDNQNTYDTLKAKYDSLKNSYNQQKTILDEEIKTYNVQKNAYEKKVDYWNKKGGAPEEKYLQLEQEKNNLNYKISEINSNQANLNNLVDDINALATVLNKLVYRLNLTADKYNGIGNKFSGEFQEGIYKNDSTGQEINIYQFNDEEKLIRVLTHELGHALGIEHLDDPEAIMYRLNQGENLKLTPADISALKNICKK